MNPFLKSKLGEDPVVCEILLSASPARVFKAWTDPEEIKSWFGHEPFSVEKADIELRVGGTWLFVFDNSKEHYNAIGGEYLVIEENARLSFTWRHEWADESGTIRHSPVSEVNVVFAASGMSTALTLTHRNLSTDEARRNVSGGWGPAFRALTEKFDAGKEADRA